MSAPQPGFRITSITAFTAIDDDDEEGLCAFFDAERSTWVPLVAADEKRLNQLRSIAADIARATGKEIVERRFVPEAP